MSVAGESRPRDRSAGADPRRRLLWRRRAEMDDALGVLKDKHEREKDLLVEENRKLMSETDKVSLSGGWGGGCLRASGGNRVTGPAGASCAPLWTS